MLEDTSYSESVNKVQDGYDLFHTMDMNCSLNNGCDYFQKDLFKIYQMTFIILIFR